MVEWALVGLGVAAGGVGLAWYRERQRRRHGRAWAPLLEAVAAKHQGRASTTTDEPGLRCTVDGLTVTLTLFDVHRGVAATRAEVDVPLPDTGNIVRLHIGWDQLGVPEGLDHVPVVDADTAGLDGSVVVRADNAAAAARFVSAATLDLVDVRREALAQAVEVTVRGGYLQLRLHGMQAHEATLARAGKVAAALAQRIDQVSRGTDLAS